MEVHKETHSLSSVNHVWFSFAANVQKTFFIAAPWLIIKQHGLYKPNFFSLWTRIQGLCSQSRPDTQKMTIQWKEIHIGQLTKSVLFHWFYPCYFCFYFTDICIEFYYSFPLTFFRHYFFSFFLSFQMYHYLIYIRSLQLCFCFLVLITHLELWPFFWELPLLCSVDLDILCLIWS